MPTLNATTAESGSCLSQRLAVGRPWIILSEVDPSSPWIYQQARRDERCSCPGKFLSVLLVRNRRNSFPYYFSNISPGRIILRSRSIRRGSAHCHPNSVVLERAAAGGRVLLTQSAVTINGKWIVTIIESICLMNRIFSTTNSSIDGHKWSFQFGLRCQSWLH